MDDKPGYPSELIILINLHNFLQDPNIFWNFFNVPWLLNNPDGVEFYTWSMTTISCTVFFFYMMFSLYKRKFTNNVNNGDLLYVD